MEKWHKAMQISNKMQKIAENIEIRNQLSPYKQFQSQGLSNLGLELFSIDENFTTKIDYGGFLRYAKKFIYESTDTISGMFQKKLISEPDKDRLLSELVILNREISQLKNLTRN